MKKEIVSILAKILSLVVLVSYLQKISVRIYTRGNKQ